jgi:hypothetical protein
MNVLRQLAGALVCTGKKLRMAYSSDRGEFSMRAAVSVALISLGQAAFAVPISYGLGGSITGNCFADETFIQSCTLPVGGYITIDNTPLPGATDPGSAEYRTDGPNQGMSIFSVGGFHDIWDVQVRIANDLPGTIFGGPDTTTDLAFFSASGTLGMMRFIFVDYPPGDAINDNSLDLPSFSTFAAQCFDSDGCSMGMRFPDMSLGFNSFRTVGAQDTTYDWRIWQLPSVIPVLRVPEPGSLSLCAAGLIALAFARRRTVFRTESTLFRERALGALLSWFGPLRSEAV